MLGHLSPEGHPAEPVLCHQVPGVFTYCDRMQLVQSSVQPSFVREEERTCRVGKRVAGTEAEISDPASVRAPEKATFKPRRHWEWTGGESRRWVGTGLLFIQTRAEQMNRFNKIMSKESKLLKVQPQQCDLGWAERFVFLSGKTRQVSIFAHSTPGLRERERERESMCVSKTHLKSPY